MCIILYLLVAPLLYDKFGLLLKKLLSITTSIAQFLIMSLYRGNEKAARTNATRKKTKPKGILRESIMQTRDGEFTAIPRNKDAQNLDAAFGHLGLVVTNHFL